MIKVSKRSHDNILAFDVSGEISLEDVKLAESTINDAIKKYGKINWLVHLTDGLPSHTTMRAFYEDMMWMIKSLKHFDKMAFVCNNNFAKALFVVDGFFFGEKYFDVSQLEDAWKYIES
jgi:hypothetical protein